MFKKKNWIKKYIIIQKKCKKKYAQLFEDYEFFKELDFKIVEI